MYTNSQIAAVMQELTSNAFGNPHSRNPSSLAAEREMVRARQQVLDFFNAAEDEYTVIWTR